MTIPIDEKIPLLKCFYTKLEDLEWKKMDSKDKHKIVLEQFPIISKEFCNLSPKYRTIISDVMANMGEKIAQIIERKINTVDDYELYCHSVGGAFCDGLVSMYHSSGLEEGLLKEDQDGGYKIGIFLQKVNIIRDYFEDLHEGREFWPKYVWGKHFNNVGELSNPANKDKAVHCLNELITDALELVPDSIAFLSRFKNQGAFNILAIPQVMAMATLERCYNNPRLFTSIVKIRKGEAIRMMLNTNNVDNVKSITRHYVLKIHQSIPEDDPSGSLTRAVCQRALKATEGCDEYRNTRILPSLFVCLGLVTSAAIGYVFHWDKISHWCIIRELDMI